MLDTESIKNKFKAADRVLRVISKDGMFRAAVIKNTVCAQTAQKRHNLNYFLATFLAKQMSAASLLASFLKGEERVIVETISNGLINRITAEALQVGEARGYLEAEPPVFDVDFNDFDRLIGNEGYFRVSRILYDKHEPIIGIVPLESADTAKNLALYLHKSEQIASSVLIDASLDDKGNILQSGALLVQAMPGASQTSIEEVAKHLQGIERISSMLERSYNCQQILSEALPFEFEELKSTRVDFFCRCSKDNFINKLVTLGLDEIKSMKAAGNNELVCHYCNAHYYLDDNDFNRIIQELQAKRN